MKKVYNLFWTPKALKHCKHHFQFGDWEYLTPCDSIKTAKKIAVDFFDADRVTWEPSTNDNGALIFGELQTSHLGRGDTYSVKIVTTHVRTLKPEKGKQQ